MKRLKKHGMKVLFEGRAVFEDRGYPAVYWPDHPLARKHGVIYVHQAAVFALGILVPDGYEIHHDNDNKWDWTSENLKVVTHTEHMRAHRIAVPVYARCARCGAEIVRRRSEARTERLFCSTRCAGFERPAKIAWPEYSELVKMVGGRSFEAVARELGVSGNAIRHHLARHAPR